MKRITALFLCMSLCIASAVFLSGCSSNSTSSTTLTEGPADDAGYSTARETAEGQINNMLLTLSGGLAFTDAVTTPGLGKTYADSFSYHAGSGWWVSYDTQEYDEYYYYYSDSLRFSADGSVQQTPDSLTDKMEYKYHMGLNSAEGSSYLYEFDFDCDWVFSGLDTDTLAINGTGGYEYGLTYDNENYSFTLNDSYQNIKVAIDDEYPHSGTLSETLSGYLYTEEGYESATYTIRITFHEDYYSAYVADDTYYWEWEEEYPANIGGYWAPPHP